MILTQMYMTSSHSYIYFHVDDYDFLSNVKLNTDCFASSATWLRILESGENPTAGSLR